MKLLSGRMLSSLQISRLPTCFFRPGYQISWLKTFTSGFQYLIAYLFFPLLGFFFFKFYFCFVIVCLFVF